MYCRRCGAPLHEGLVICPECGSRQRRRFSAVRCAECNGRVALGLTVCPYCGRNVRPAGPRFGLWLAGLLLLGLAGLWGAGKLPVEKVLGEVASARERIASVVQVLGPATSARVNEDEGEETAQVPGEGDSEEVVVTGSGPLPVESAGAEGGTPDAGPAALPVPTESTPVAGTLALTPAATLEPSISPTLEPTLAPTDAPTATPTAEPTATPTTEPTAAPTAAPTATPTPVPPTPAPQPTAAPAQPAGTTKYKVKSGDTLSSIATKFGITWQVLAEANKLTSKSVLRVGQELIIPGKPGAVSVAPTATPEKARPTAVPPTPAPSLAAPVLRSPGDQTPINGANSFELVWEPVQDFPGGAQYQVVILWTDQEGQPSQGSWLTSANTMFVPTWLYQRAAQPARKYTWYVTVVQVTTDGKGGERIIPLSPQSATRVFYWS